MANSNKRAKASAYLRRGEPMVWATGVALSMILLAIAVFLIVVLVNGLGVFWPARLALVELTDGMRVLGEIQEREPIPDKDAARTQYKIGNRDLYGLDFRWIDDSEAALASYPEDAITVERQEYGNFYGFLENVASPAVEGNDWTALRDALEAIKPDLRRLEALDRDTTDIGIRLNRVTNGEPQKADANMTPRELEVKNEFMQVATAKTALLSELEKHSATLTAASGESVTIPLLDIVRVYRPNEMNLFEKSILYAAKLKDLFIENPRESNTEGGLFPAIFGTVILVFLMSLLSFPLGVIAGIFLREYAREGVFLRSVRIAVNNLAGVPSIVYGIFGLGFFVYGVGATLDRFFFSDKLPTPTFGTGGILWASLTLGLLTVPVVIVSTEEALGAIPRGVREGSLSLGATKFQTLWRVLLPMASPGILTGFILAMARAAGEVAPLMITGVVKLAPTLPIDSHFPFFHLDRKFMHLGFHIFDIGFQSPNVEAAKPMVFVTTLLLVMIVLLMSSSAIILRNRMKRKYTVTSL